MKWFWLLLLYGGLSILYMLAEHGKEWVEKRLWPDDPEDDDPEDDDPEDERKKRT